MTIEFHCPSCQKLLRTADDKAGTRANCPDCGTRVNVPAADGAASEEFDDGEDRYGVSAPQAPPSATGGSTKMCPMCGEQIKAAAVRCRYCGEDLDDDGGYDRPRRRNPKHLKPHRGGVVLTLGILSVVMGICGLIFGPIAWTMGKNDLEEIARGRMDPSGEGTTKAGKICGIIGTCIASVIAVVYVIVFAIIIGNGGRL